MLEPLGRGDRLDARVHAALIQTLAVVGVQVELPEAVAVVDRTLLVVVAREVGFHFEAYDNRSNILDQFRGAFAEFVDGQLATPGIQAAAIAHGLGR